MDDVTASQFFLYLVHRNDENPIFQLWESKSCLISTLNKCRIMFALTYFDMGRCLYMFEQKKEKKLIQNTWKIVRWWHHQLTHLHIHINCSRNVSLKITKILNSLSCSKVFTFSIELFNLDLTWTWFLLYYPSQSLDSWSCYHSAPSSLPGEHSGQVRSNIRGSHAILSDKYYIHLHPIGCPSG